MGHDFKVGDEVLLTDIEALSSEPILKDVKGSILSINNNDEEELRVAQVRFGNVRRSYYLWRLSPFIGKCEVTGILSIDGEI